MKSLDHHHKRADEGEVEAALDTALVVVDTNVLLDLYRASDELRTKRLAILRHLGERLFVPHQVIVEFHRNRLRAIGELADAYKDVRLAIASLRTAGSKFGAPNGRFESSANKVTRLVDEAAATLSAKLEALHAEDPHAVNRMDDPVLSALETILDGRVGEAPRPKTITRRFREFVEVRVPLQMPPGFRDADKRGGSDPARSAGDYFLWCEVLKVAKGRATDIVLVTADSKDDWWQFGTAGRPTVPHPALVDELATVTGQRYFQLRSDEFMRIAARVLGVEVTKREQDEELAIADANNAAAEARDAFQWALSGAELDALRTLAQVREAAFPKIDPRIFEVAIPKIDPRILEAAIPRIDPSIIEAAIPKMGPILSESLARYAAAARAGSLASHHNLTGAEHPPDEGDPDEDDDSARGQDAPLLNE